MLPQPPNESVFWDSFVEKILASQHPPSHREDGNITWGCSQGIIPFFITFPNRKGATKMLLTASVPLKVPRTSVSKAGTQLWRMIWKVQLVEISSRKPCTVWFLRKYTIISSPVSQLAIHTFQSGSMSFLSLIVAKISQHKCEIGRLLNPSRPKMHQVQTNHLLVKKEHPFIALFFAHLNR